MEIPALSVVADVILNIAVVIRIHLNDRAGGYRGGGREDDLAVVAALVTAKVPATWKPVC